MHRGKRKQIQQTKENVNAIMMPNKNTKAMVGSPKCDINLFDITTAILQGDTSVLYIFIISQDYVGWLVGWVLWHINLCRLFNAKSIIMKIVLFQTIQFRIST